MAPVKRETNLSLSTGSPLPLPVKVFFYPFLKEGRPVNALIFAAFSEPLEEILGNGDAEGFLHHCVIICLGTLISFHIYNILNTFIIHNKNNRNKIYKLDVGVGGTEKPLEGHGYNGNLFK